MTNSIKIIYAQQVHNFDLTNLPSIRGMLDYDCISSAKPMSRAELGLNRLDAILAGSFYFSSQGARDFFRADRI